MDITHVMDETTFCVCSILAFSSFQAALSAVPKNALKSCQEDNKKVITMCGAINDAIFDGVFKPGKIRIKRSRNEV